MLFVDKNSTVDKEALRKHVLESLSTTEAKAEKLIHGVDYHSFWNKVHSLIVLDENKRKKGQLLSSERQITSLVDFIQSWKNTSVDSPERLEFFIQVKASEIRSGDTQKDYFWALQIRHDQLVALVEVLNDFLEQVEHWVEDQPENVINQDIFKKLADVSIDDQVYLKAATIHDTRTSLST